MALSQKQYDMAFQLSAKLNSDFSGTFSRAQKVLTETQREIKELNKMQSDISAYEKQRQAVSNTERKLSDLQKQYDNIQREMEETGSFSSDLQNKLIDKQRAIDKTVASLEKGSSKLDEMEKELQEAGIDTAHLGEKSEELAKKQDQLARENQAAADSAQNFGSTGTSAFEAVGSALVAAGIAEGLKRIYEAYKECVSIAADFHETLSAVEAISGASAEDMEILQTKAKELGATTKFTATEAAEAMTYMSMAGWDATQMVSGMDGVMQLAAASGEDLAQVSDIVTDNLTAFGLKASDTAHFSDVLAAAATNSNTSVGVMGETFKNCAPLAGALGYSVEDVAVAVGLMANAGIKGSNAGTALKNIFNGLLGEITLTSAAFGEVEYSAVKSDGTMKSFGETLDDLRGYFAQMTGAEKMANAEALVGQRAMAGFVQLMNSTSTDIEKLEGSIRNCTGAAEKMAKVRLDNLNGQVTLMNSAADALKTTVGDLWSKELQGLAKIGTDILAEINTFVEENPTVVKSIMLIVGALGLAVGAYTTITAVKKSLNAIRTVSNVLKAKEIVATGALTAAEGAEAAATVGATTAQNALNASMMASPVGWLAAAIGAIVVSMAKLVQEAKNFHDKVYADSIEMKQAIDDYNSSVEELNSSYENTVGAAEESYNQALGYIERLRELETQGLKTNEQQGEYNTLVERLRALMPDLNLELDEQTGLLKSSADELERQIKYQKELAKVNAIKDYATQLEKDRLELQLKHNEAVSKQGDLWKRYEEERRAESIATTGQVKEELSFFERIGRYLSGAAGDTSIPTGTYNTSGIKALVFHTEEYKKAAEEQDTAVKESQKLLDESDKKINQLWDDYRSLNDMIDEGTTSVANYSSANEYAIDILSDVSDRLSTLEDQYRTSYDAAYESISGQYNLWDKAAEVIPTDIDTINTALETQTAYWDDYNTDLSSLLNRTGDIDGLADVIAHFADGSTDSVNAIAGMAAASDDDLKIMVDNWKQVQQMQQDASDTIASFDIEKELEGAQSDFEIAVESMDMSEVAKTSAQNTMEAYISALRSGTLDAVNAAKDISSLVKNALAGEGVFSSRYIKNVSEKRTDIMPYASGTIYAAPGYALVGENGPELVRMSGGEQVYTAAETAQILRGGNSSNTFYISPTIQINGNSNETNADDIVESVSDKLVPIIIDAIRDEVADAKRGAYE